MSQGLESHTRSKKKKKSGTLPIEFSFATAEIAALGRQGSLKVSNVKKATGKMEGKNIDWTECILELPVDHLGVQIVCRTKRESKPRDQSRYYRYLGDFASGSLSLPSLQSSAEWNSY